MIKKIVSKFAVTCMKCFLYNNTPGMPNIHFNGDGSITIHCLECLSSETIAPNDPNKSTKKDYIETMKHGKTKTN